METSTISQLTADAVALGAEFGPVVLAIGGIAIGVVAAVKGFGLVKKLLNRI